MPAGLRQFAEYQPFTPMMDSMRALLAGHSPGTGTLLAALAWSAGLALVGYVWAKHRYNRT